MSWVPISYRGYWDVPRIILTRHDGHLYLLDCSFSDELDDYPDDYTVFLLPAELHEENLPDDWTTLTDLAIRRLGAVPVAGVTFDPTRRKQVDAAVLDALTAHPARASG